MPHTGRRIRGARAPALPARARAAEGGPRRRLRRPRGARARLRQAPGADARSRSASRAGTCAPDPRPGAAGAGHARLHDRLQADPALQPLVSGARAGRTSSWSPTRSARSASTRSSPRTGPSARSTRSSSAPASTSPTCRSASGCAAAAGSGSPTPGRGARARTSARPIAGFPNLFVLLGPNTGLGHSSMVYMIESQIEHVLGALRVMRERGAAVAEVRAGGAGGLQPRDRREAGRHGVDHRLRELVPGRARGATRRSWPDWTWRFRQRTRRFDPAAHRLTPAGGRARAVRHERARAHHRRAGGIGGAAAAALRARGARVIGLDLARRPERDVLACDVRDQAAVDAAVAEAIARLGGLDVLINNAGLGIPQSAGERARRGRARRDRRQPARARGASPPRRCPRCAPPAAGSSTSRPAWPTSRSVRAPRTA